MNDELPDNISTVNAVEFAAEMMRGWKGQTDRIIGGMRQSIAIATIVAVIIISGLNWTVQYRISHSTAILDSTRVAVAQNKSMIDGLREDRALQQTRFQAIMSGFKNIELALDRRDRRR